MNSSFAGLATGMVFALLLVYLLMVVNFQSWLDPFIILTALPGALAGIAWMLYVTQTTLSVPALMGAIMCIGVATSNSILMVTFANDRRHEGADAREAALAAGDAAPPGVDDCAGNDHRHAADVAGTGRRGRRKCSAGPSRHRRTAHGNRVHACVCARHVQPDVPDCSAAAPRGSRGISAWAIPIARRRIMSATDLHSSPPEAPAPEASEQAVDKPRTNSATPTATTAAEHDLPVHPWRSNRVGVLAVAIVVVLAALGVMATLPRLANDRALTTAANQVSTASPRHRR